MESSGEENENTVAESIVVKSNYRKIIDSESSEDEKELKIDTNENSEDENKISTNKTNSRILSSSSESEDEEKPVKNRRKGNPKKLDVKMPKEKLKRKSAKAAMENIKEELNKNEKPENKEIRIPYHKPKQYSLKEFLARRTINKPSIENIKEPKLSNPVLKMKMNSQELEKFAQKMKEREEEAMEFFKSESESEGEEKGENKNKEVEENKIEKVEEELKEETKEVITAVDVTTEENEHEPLDNDKIQQPEILDKENISENVKEEPKLLKTLNELSEKDAIIDLTTGAVQTKKLNGPEMLFQRYLKSINKPKHKDSVCMNIMSIENGKLENSRVEVKLDKEVELDHNRPGFSHEKLKENLRNKIVQMRLEVVKKKALKPEEFEPEEKCKEVLEEKSADSDEEYEPEQSEDEDFEIDEEEELVENKKKPKSQFVNDEVKLKFLF